MCPCACKFVPALSNCLCRTSNRLLSARGLSGEGTTEEEEDKDEDGDGLEWPPLYRLDLREK